MKVQQQDKPIILFAILYWGLGHATRSIPIIEHLLTQGYKCVICTDGPVVPFLERELKQHQDITYEFLPPYDIQYRSNSMVWNMITQLPKIYSAYRREKIAFRHLVTHYNPVACFSDNRYGCVTSVAPSFFIGHQWNIMGPRGRIMGLTSKINHWFIQSFSALLIPDEQDSRLSGDLSRNISGLPYHYIGIQSRFQRQVKRKTTTFKVLLILSGPEPARTVFEAQLLELLVERHQSFPDEEYAIVRGTNRAIDPTIPPFIHHYAIADTAELYQLVCSTACVISRSGYSSLMDYEALGLSQVLLVPTPGQTEQEYLARNAPQDRYHYVSQDKLSQRVLSTFLGESPNNTIVTNQVPTKRKIVPSKIDATWAELQRVYGIQKP